MKWNNVLTGCVAIGIGYGGYKLGCHSTEKKYRDDVKELKRSLRELKEQVDDLAESNSY